MVHVNHKKEATSNVTAPKDTWEPPVTVRMYKNALSDKISSDKRDIRGLVIKILVMENFLLTNFC